MLARTRERIRLGLLAAIALLFVVSIPWYRETGAVSELVWGLPAWVTVALGCYVGVALLNSLAWALTDVRDEEPRPDSVESTDRASGGDERGGSA
jgi:hypothetical protein